MCEVGVSSAGHQPCQQLTTKPFTFTPVPQGVHTCNISHTVSRDSSLSAHALMLHEGMSASRCGKMSCTTHPAVSFR